MWLQCLQLCTVTGASCHHSPASHEHSVRPGLLLGPSTGWSVAPEVPTEIHISPTADTAHSSAHQQAGQARQGAGSEDVFGQMVLLPLGR